MSTTVRLPDYVRQIDGPAPLRRLLINARLRAIDEGWTRRRALKTHIVICGFARAGSTLLGLMLQVAYPAARAFPKERAALRVAYLTDRSHSLMISKRPDDLFYVDRIREIYRRRRPSVRFLFTMRDPRAVMTSVHASKKGRYYVSPERWRATYQMLQTNRGRADCCVVRFEDMVTNIERVQREIVRFIGEEPEVPFDQFVEKVPEGFRATALNGVRALDPATTTKWRHPRHHERIRSLLEAVPELPRVLIDNGYETDTSWVDRYASASPGDAAHTGRGASV